RVLFRSAAGHVAAAAIDRGRSIRAGDVAVRDVDAAHLARTVAFDGAGRHPLAVDAAPRPDHGPAARDVGALDLAVRAADGAASGASMAAEVAAVAAIVRALVDVVALQGAAVLAHAAAARHGRAVLGAVVAVAREVALGASRALAELPGIARAAVVAGRGGRGREQKSEGERMPGSERHGRDSIAKFAAPVRTIRRSPGVFERRAAPGDARDSHHPVEFHAG